MTSRRGVVHTGQVIAIAVVVTVALSPPASASFPGTNGKIAYSQQVPSAGMQVFDMDPSGQNQRSLTASADLNGETNPTYSPDGETIAFESQLGPSIEIFTMHADGTGIAPLTTTSAGAIDPGFSADGSRVAYSRNVMTGGRAIFAIGLAPGSQEIQLTDSGGSNDYDPALSPDGTRMAFWRTSGFGRIYVAGADGSNPTPITPAGEQSFEPSWSPDGSQIVFTRMEGGDNEIYVMGADGSNPTPLTNDATSENAPVFSPDGTRIAFTRFGPGQYEIVAMDPNGANQTPLNQAGTAPTFDPTWQSLNPPALTLTAEEVQKSSKTVAVSATSQNENASLTAGGTGSAPKPKLTVATESKKKTFDLDPVSLQLATGAVTPFELTIPKKGSKLVKRALKAGKKAKVTVTATATDDLGATSSATAEVKIKKKGKK